MTKPEFKATNADGHQEETGEAGTRERSSRRLRRVHSSSGGGKRGRRPSRVDRNAKLERSRQSARECRARKKQKYQLLEETVTAKEKQILSLREKLEKYKNFCQLMDDGEIPDDLVKTLKEDAAVAEEEEEEEEDTGALRTSSTDLPFHSQSLGADSSSDDDSD